MRTLVLGPRYQEDVAVHSHGLPPFPGAKEYATAEPFIEGRRPEHNVFQFPVHRVTISSKSSARHNTTSSVRGTAVLWDIRVASIGGRVDQCTSPFTVEC